MTKTTKKNCQHICNLFEGGHGGALYAFGDKFCDNCKHVFKPSYAGVWCPCCGDGLKLKNREYWEYYKEDHYSKSFLERLERRKRRQCSYCKSFVSKHANYRVYGNVKEPGAAIQFYQEWRTDQLGNTICYDCNLTLTTLKSLSKHIEEAAMKYKELDLDIPDEILGSMKEVFAIFTHTHSVRKPEKNLYSVLTKEIETK